MRKVIKRENVNKKKRTIWKTRKIKGLSISGQLFSILIFLFLCLTLVVEVTVKYNFSEGFYKYLNEREEQRINIWSKSLEDIYKKNGSWDIFKNQEDGWWRLLLQNKEIGLNFDNKRYQTEKINGKSSSESLSNATTPDVPSISLVSADQKKIIAGKMPYKDRAMWRGLYVNDQIVGWLVMPKVEKGIFNEIDREFLSSQSNDMFWIVVVGGLVSGILGLILAQRILKPIKQLANATRNLAEGDYKTQVPEGRADEIGQLASDFNKMVQILDSNEKSRKDMMADISHELRTPITVIRSEIEAMIDGVRDFSADNLESLLNEINGLNRLVDDIHDLAKAETGGWKYKFDDVDMLQIINDKLNLFDNRIREKGLTPELKVDSGKMYTILGDHGRMCQLIKNLIENSIRYTDAGGKIRIEIKNRNNRLLVLKIKDSKPGIDDEFLTSIFERFYRVESSRNKAYGGSGLGLALCKQIVEHHHGKIYAEQSDLGGLSIVIKLPLKKTLIKENENDISS